MEQTQKILEYINSQDVDKQQSAIRTAGELILEEKKVYPEIAEGILKIIESSDYENKTDFRCTQPDKLEIIIGFFIRCYALYAPQEELFRFIDTFLQVNCRCTADELFEYDIVHEVGSHLYHSYNFAAVFREYGLKEYDFDSIPHFSEKFYQLLIERIEKLLTLPAERGYNSAYVTVGGKIDRYIYIAKEYTIKDNFQYKQQLGKLFCETVIKHPNTVISESMFNFKEIADEKTIDILIKILDLGVRREILENTTGKTLPTERIGYSCAHFAFIKLLDFTGDGEAVWTEIKNLQWTERHFDVVMEIIDNILDCSSSRLKKYKEYDLLKQALLYFSDLNDSRKRKLVLRMLVNLGHLSIDQLPSDERPVKPEDFRGTEDFRDIVSTWNMILKLRNDSFDFSPAEGAKEEELDELEKALELVLPAEYRQLLTLSNGVADSSFFYELPSNTSFWDADDFKSASQMLTDYHEWLELGEEMAEDYSDEDIEDIDLDDQIKACGFNNKWLPIISFSNGDQCCIDLDPTEKGNAGQIIRVYHDEVSRKVLAPSLKDFLIQYYASRLNAINGWKW